MGVLVPLTDVLNLRLSGRFGYTFAVPRGLGSASFVAANIIMGGLLLTQPTEAIIVWLVAASLGVTVVAVLALPAEPVADGGPLRGRERFCGIGRLLKDPVFMTAIFAIGAVQAAHAYQYGFSAILWKTEGISEAVTGQLWAFGVIAEILLMWLFEPWRRRVGITP